MIINAILFAVTVIVLVTLHWYLSLLAQTIFMHRYAAHGQLKMSKKQEKIWFIFSFITQGPSYLTAWGYGIFHRIHHRFADTVFDSHPARLSRNLLSMMLLTAKRYSAIVRQDEKIIEAWLGEKGGMKLIEKLSKNVPRWDQFDKFAHNWITRVLWIALYVLFYIGLISLFGLPGWVIWVVLPIILLHSTMGPLHGALVNWYAHKRGYRNYASDDDSTNVLAWDWLMLGEWLHNNHHGRKYRPNFAHKDGEFDPGYWVMTRILVPLRLVQLKN